MPKLNAELGDVTANRPVDAGAWLKFLIASGVGAFLFLTPFKHDGVWKIPLGVLSDVTTEAVRPGLGLFAVFLVLVSAIGTTAYKVFGIGRGLNSESLDRLFNPAWAWLVMRILGAVTIIAIYWKLGPEWLHSEAVGGLVIDELIAVIIVIFFFAGLFLPLLTDYGLMEFIGALMQKHFRRLFTMPGRSAVDATASWMGSGTVGVLITMRQYDEGFYNAREAAVIATNFSIVSTAFCYAVASLLKVDHLFIQFYAVVVVSGIVCALILPRIPPLSLKPNTYKEGVTPQNIEEQDHEGGFARAIQLATQRAANSLPFPEVAKNAVVNVLDIWLGLLPGVVFIGTLSLAVAEQTPVFDILSTPFLWILELARVPEAAEAAPAMIIGFADMFLPAIIAQDVESEFTRFIVAVVSVGQLLYMSELGVLILRSSIPVGIFDLAIIFLLRTAIVLPFAIIGAHLFT